MFHQDDKMNVKCFEFLVGRHSINANWNCNRDITFMIVFSGFLRA